MATKVCSSCKEEKDVSAYYSRKISVDGLRGQCKKCEKRYGSKWHKEGRWRDWHYRRSYGISEGSVGRLLLTQGSKCAICSSHLDFPSRKTHLDHDHKTGEVRGILCSRCNTGLGKFNDSIETLEKAIRYLKGK